jgi:hypothetical protein
MQTTNLAQLTHATWEQHVGSQFALHHGENAVENVTLLEISKLSTGRTARPGAREPFAIVLRAGRREFYLPQCAYSVSHPAIGKMEIFLVPIGPDEVGMRFEAIFA